LAESPLYIIGFRVLPPVFSGILGRPAPGTVLLLSLGVAGENPLANSRSCQLLGKKRRKKASDLGHGPKPINEAFTDDQGMGEALFEDHGS